ncbi:MAG: hypothetical protein ACXVDJ_03990, partial [Tumebacillaceae bacterium]
LVFVEAAFRYALLEADKRMFDWSFQKRREPCHCWGCGVFLSGACLRERGETARRGRRRIMSRMI